MIVNSIHRFYPLILIVSSTEKAFNFDRIAEGPLTVDSDSVNSLIQGYNVGLFRLGTSETDAKEQQQFFQNALSNLDGFFERAEVSFGLYSFTDGHCVDLLTFDRLEVDNLAHLYDIGSELEPIDGDFDAVEDAIQRNASSNPMALVLKFRVASGEQKLWSHLVLADLGVFGNGALSQSIGHLKNLALLLNQPFVRAEIPFGHCRLTTFMQPFLGGNSECHVQFDLSPTAEPKVLLGTLQLADALRHVHNHPECNVEPGEIEELTKLMQASSLLQDQQKETKAQVKSLKKSLAQLQKEKREIEESSRGDQVHSDVELYERELAKAQLAMDNLAIQEKLRQCEIELVCMSHRSTKLACQIYELEFSLASAREELSCCVEENEQIQESCRTELDALRGEMESTSRDLGKTIQELEKEKSSLDKQAKGKIEALEKSLLSAEATRKKLEEDLRLSLEKERSKASEAEKRFRTELEASLKAARKEEESLKERLGEMVKEQQASKTKIGKLEGEMGALRIENETLKAKLDVYSSAMHRTNTGDDGSSVKLALAEIELKMAKEREAMAKMMSSIMKERGDRGERKLSQSEKENATAVNKRAKKGVPLKTIGSDVGDYTNYDDDEADYETETKIPVKRKTLPPKSEAPAVKLKPKAKQAPAAKPAEPAPTPRLFLKASEKLTAPVATPVPAAPQSPVKVFKPSTYIPGVVAKPAATTASAGIKKPGFLSNLSFHAKDSALAAAEQSRKRIKLPERAAANPVPAAAGASSGLGSRRNIDPAVMSAIMSNFTVPKQD